MIDLSMDTHRFYSGTIYDGIFGIYQVVRHLLNFQNQISNNEIHKQTVDYYFKHKNEDEYGWCPNAQRHALANLYDVTICVLTVGKNEQIIPVSYYGENPSLKKFIYILYNETTFKYCPLCATNQADPTEEITEFIHTDRVKILLGEFVREHFHYTSKIDFGDIPTNHGFIPMDPDTTITISDSNLMMESQKRKRPNVDDISLSTQGNQLLSPTNSIYDNDDDHDLNKHIKYAHNPSDDLSKLSKIPVQFKTIKHLMHNEDESDINSPLNEEQMQNSSMIFNDTNQEQNLEWAKPSINDFHDSEKSKSDDDSSMLKSTMQSSKETEPSFFVFQ